jgi:rhodanese-related sulfurtransferase
MSIPAFRQTGIPSVGAHELADNAVIIDVREPEEWAAGHAPGAIHIPLAELPSRLDELPDTDEPVAVTCRGGGRSSRAVAWLSMQGFDVVNLDGGMRSWAGSGKPLAADEGDEHAPHVL